MVYLYMDYKNRQCEWIRKGKACVYAEWKYTVLTAFLKHVKTASKIILLHVKPNSQTIRRLKRSFHKLTK